MNDSTLVRVARLQLLLARIHAKVAAAELLMRRMALRALERSQDNWETAAPPVPRAAARPTRPTAPADDSLAAYA